MAYHPGKRWYLPENYPVFWDEVRRRLRGRGTYKLAIFTAILLLGVGLGFILPALIPDAIGGGLWHGLLWLQGVLVLFLIPGLAASAFTVERERGALDFLLLLPISTRSLVLQKCAGVCSLLVYLMAVFFPTGLISAVMSVSPLDGINPLSRSATFEMFGVQCLYQLLRGVSFIAIGIAASSLCRNTRTAAVWTYSIIFVLEFLFMRLVWLVLFRGFIFSENMRTFYEYQPLMQSLLYMVLTLIALVISVYAIDRLRSPAIYAASSRQEEE
ncbi:MAG: ABC transporter permease [Armatimonadota bacterium]